MANGTPPPQEDENQTQQTETLKYRLLEVKDGQIAKYESQREQIRAGIVKLHDLPSIPPPNLKVSYWQASVVQGTL